ncbi:dihydrolipoamide acetyltransferase family protein [Bacteroides intestinalis]|jgi:2-oxoglutarate dehydrogenase E2 component (dihydrolipoamide succinyltransferase)|uniref:Dihydrolipoamide acetyltransferase component of pyruvate dehydrogenase complex n=1 Tax=Bacteroides intestinalis TaxID=329854 RepID=A0AAQ0RRT4_9BACE|nr:dihydrolipoamide acetyltransferase family protein [Bacteroides intestinalis]QDO68953.1 2-oxo acid dehydrogenase subunit E2 [Bacteroides intestinalis]RGT52074.1 2-oxo acid dehydrogenase subunit E2 [Bacteroides intestinalis]RGX84208.1 2-oxo acid dehydrogenase subunit E2 [Bacteroides intestinalis]RHN06749.1 2-oxo acid dehydrogenase subunit E2 [Bacteroides intestinalis]UCB37180.1 2-oxo acid dehydrogenase subunit E2 [Bacteroides intestinalis]
MSRFEIKMPKLGESITEGTIISWSVQVGDIIKEDDVLFEVNTAKVSAEIPSPVEGKVVEILFKEGDTVAVGTVVAIVDIGGENSEDEDSVEALQSSATDESVAVVSKAASEETPQVKAVKSEEERWYSPVVLQLAREAGIQPKELDTIPGTGYQGRVSKKDIKSYIVRKQSGGIMTAKPAATPEIQRTAPASGTFSAEGVEVKEMDRVRKVIADHMVMSKHTSPHVTNVVEVDVTKLVKWRDKNKDAFFRREGVKLTYMPAITEAVAKALAAYPQVNVSVEGYNILFKKHINIGIAVSLNDGNLIVPVVRDADRLNLNGLAVAIDSLALKARDNKLMPDDISGGTFTITNFGTFKSLFGTPIINQPQVAILGVGYIEKKPAVIETPEGDVIAIRHKMYLSLSYDHRVVDGSLGGNFLYFIKEYLENWKE